jgi:activator of 2-hydroxyglutaryl-CoA dehydratase
MIFGGVDIGSLSADAVIMADGRIIAHSVLPTGGDSTGSAYHAMEAALEKTSFRLEELLIPFRQDMGGSMFPSLERM